MKRTCLWVVMTALCWTSAAAQGTHLTKDPLTGLPLIPATDPTRSGSPPPNVSPTLLKYMGNAPVEMPGAVICRSKFQGNFYQLVNSKTDAIIAWYGSHLPGFKTARSATGSTTVFFSDDRTILVIVMGTPGGNANSVSYERYQPGLSQKTITGLTQGKMLCS